MKQKLTKQTSKNWETTLAIIKPDGVERGLVLECLNRIRKADLEITKEKKFWMNKEFAEEFRADIKEKHPTIFPALIQYMTQGPCIALLVSGENAITKLREICGATNSKDAKEGTIRGDFGDKSLDMKELYKQGKVIKNIIHSSGNEKEAQQEIELIFGGIA